MKNRGLLKIVGGRLAGMMLLGPLFLLVGHLILKMLAWPKLTPSAMQWAPTRSGSEESISPWYKTWSWPLYAGKFYGYARVN
jgi:hypothetical protein